MASMESPDQKEILVANANTPHPSWFSLYAKNIIKGYIEETSGIFAK